MGSQIVLLSGPPHAGKSAVAEALCARYDRMAHIDVRALGSLIRMGRLRPWDRSPDGRAQRELLISLACGMATRFVAGGYGVVIGDVVLPDDVRHYGRGLAEMSMPVHVIVLLPDLDIVLAREVADPSEWGRGDGGRIQEVYRRIASMHGVAVIDPGKRPSDEVADKVMEMAASGTAQLSLEGEVANRQETDDQPVDHEW